MSSHFPSTGRAPKLALGDFDHFRVFIDFIGDVASSLNAVLTFLQNLLNFLS